MVGTRGEKRAQEYIWNKLHELKTSAHEGIQFDIDLQTANGSHRFDFMGEIVMKSYRDIKNVVVRISCGPSCDQNSILVNAHYDTQVGTPGACDDATPIAVMLELARILSKQDPANFKNSLILLFNGAEETLQDASHAFSKFHPYAKFVRSFINLEAMGNTGKEVLFQANSKGLVEAYGRAVKRPHGSVSSNDLFKTGLILSDTDFRQFVEHGGMLGIDMAIYQSSFAYHTALDTPENIEPGLLQHMGDNTLDIVTHLMTDVDIHTFTEGRDFVYFDLFDTFFFVYTTATANKIHAAVILLTLAEIVRPAFMSRAFTGATGDTQSNPTRSVWAFVKTALFVCVNFVAAMIGPALLGAFTQFFVGKPMIYFRQEWFAFLIYVPSAFLGILSCHIFGRLFISSDPLDNPVAVERRVYTGNLLVSSFLILLMTAAGLGSSFILAISQSAALLALLVDRFVSPAGNGALGSHFPINPLTYFLATFMPASLCFTQAWAFAMLFVPLTGRIGPDAPVDVIMGVLVGLLLAVGGSGILSCLLSRLSYKWLLRAFMWSSIFLGLVVAMLSQQNQFSAVHPKRLFVQYSQNSTSQTESILIAHADPASMSALAQSVSQTLGNAPFHVQSAQQNDHTFSVFFPFSHFIEVFVFDLGAAGEMDPIPAVEVEELAYDYEANAREVTVHCKHPDHMAPVLHFHADVLSWSLSSPPMPGPRQHIIKHVAGYPADTFTFTFKFRSSPFGSPDAPPLYLHFTGVEKDTWDGLVPYETSRKPVTGGGMEHGWLWRNGYRSGEILRRVQSAIDVFTKGEEWTTEVYMAVDTVTTVA
ncbi:hypothetical protein BC830DRAFT_1228790, partial [Chytriomyces sp. MP71]